MWGNRSSNNSGNSNNRSNESNYSRLSNHDDRRKSPNEDPHDYREIGPNRYENEKDGKIYDQWGDLINE